MQYIHYPHSNLSKEEAEALAKRYDVIKIEQVIEAFRSAKLGLTPIKIKKPESYGTRHVIYIVTVEETAEEFIFRSSIGYGAPETVLLREKLMTDLARNAGVPVNEIIYADISRDHVPFDFQIQRKVAGEDLEDHFTGSQEKYDEISYQLGQITAKLHTVHLQNFGRFDHNSTTDNLIGDVSTNQEYIMLDLDDEVHALTEFGIISDTQARAIKEYFETRADLMNINQGVLIHYDIADHNIMFNDGHITGLIDWEAAVSSDPVLDIASMPTWKTQYPRLEKFLDGYRSVNSLPDNFKQKYEMYEFRTILWKTVFSIKAGILNDARKTRFINCLESIIKGENDGR